MNPQKVEIKMLTAQELGKSLEGERDAVEKEVFRTDGAFQALRASIPKVQALLAEVDKDLENGEIEKVAGEPLQVLALIKRWIQRSVGVVDNLATSAEIQHHRTVGRQKGLEQAVQLVFKTFNEERTKLENLQKALESGAMVVEDGGAPGDDPNWQRSHAPGAHPGEPLKGLRNAEETAQLDESPKKSVRKKKVEAPLNVENT